MTLATILIGRTRYEVLGWKRCTFPIRQGLDKPSPSGLVQRLVMFGRFEGRYYQIVKLGPGRWDNPIEIPQDMLHPSLRKDHRYAMLKKKTTTITPKTGAGLRSAPTGPPAYASMSEGKRIESLKAAANRRPAPVDDGATAAIPADSSADDDSATEDDDRDRITIPFERAFHDADPDIRTQFLHAARLHDGYARDIKRITDLYDTNRKWMDTVMNDLGIDTKTNVSIPPPYTDGPLGEVRHCKGKSATIIKKKLLANGVSIDTIAKSTSNKPYTYVQVVYKDKDKG